MKINTRLFIGFLVLLGLLTGCGGENIAPAGGRFNLERDGAIMPVVVEGNIESGVFLLLLHGGPGGSAGEYNNGRYAELLEEKYAMVYWDQRGQGGSQGQYSRESMTVDNIAEDTEAMVHLLKELYGADISVFLYGHSWGGMVGTAALVHTDVQSEVNGWIESNGAHDVPKLNRSFVPMVQHYGGQEIAAGRNTDRWQEMLDYVNSLDTNNITIPQSGQINQYGGEAESLIEDIAEGTEPEVPGRGAFHYFFLSPTPFLQSVTTGNRTQELLIPEMDNLSLTDELHKIEVPSLFLWGKYDFVVPPQLGNDALNLVSSTDKQLVILDHSGHSPMDDEPELYVQAIVDFVERNR